MDDEIIFNAAPIDVDEASAYEILWDDPTRAEEFHNALNQAAQGFWVVSFKRGERYYTLRDFHLQRLALEFLRFDPEQLKHEEEAQRRAEQWRLAAEQAAQAKRDLLRRIVFGGGAQ